MGFQWEFHDLHGISMGIDGIQGGVHDFNGISMGFQWEFDGNSMGIEVSFRVI